MVSETGPQYARPDSDVNTGNWSPTPLYQEINDNDTDLIRSENDPSNDTCKVSLSNVSDPQTGTGHVVRFRYRQQQSGGGKPANHNFTVELMQGSTIIASWTYELGKNDTDWHDGQDGQESLTEAEADSITDYSNLSLRFIANKTSGDGTRTGWMEVSWAEFEVP